MYNNELNGTLPTELGALTAATELCAAPHPLPPSFSLLHISEAARAPLRDTPAQPSLAHSSRAAVHAPVGI